MTSARNRVSDERGAALLLALLVVVLVTALGGGLLLVTSLETTIEANHQRTHAVRQAADSGLACALTALRSVADWSTALAGGAPGGSCLAPAALPPSWPGGAMVDPASLTTALQAATDARYGAGPDTPRWTLWMAGSPPGASDGPIALVLVWIADNAGEGDGAPLVDTDEVIVVRSEAFLPGGARAGAEALVGRAAWDASRPIVLNWRATR